MYDLHMYSWRNGQSLIAVEGGSPKQFIILYIVQRNQNNEIVYTDRRHFSLESYERNIIRALW